MKNNIWKRFLSVLVALAMLPMATTVLSSDLYTQKDIKAFDDNVALLYNFGLIENEECKMASTVSRGEFAAVMMKYLQFGSGVEVAVPENGKKFSDVQGEAKDIYGIVSMGLMSGYPNGTFAPEKKLVFEEAVKTLIAALGWSKYAENLGGYPNGYINYAASLELTEGVQKSQGSILTYFDLVQMLVNALSAEIYVTDNPNMELSARSWLSSRLKADKKEGTVISFNKKTNRIVIDNVTYSVTNDYTGMLGCYVKFYVDDDNNIIHLDDASRDKVAFDVSLIDSYSGKTYMIRKDENTSKTKDFKLSQEAYIIYNGVLAENLSVDDMIPDYGKVTFISNNGDSLYDAILIESYKIYVVSAIDRADGKIICKNENGKTETVDISGISEDALEIVNVSGNLIAFESIPSESVLRVGFSSDGGNVKIIVSEKVVSGSITSKSNEEDYIQITIDGVEYRTISNFPYDVNLKIGSGGKFYLDSQNLIAWVELEEKEWSYGYLIKGYYDDVEEALYLKIFDSSNEDITFACAEKIKIDGLQGKTGKETEALLKDGNSSLKKQMIRFKLNSDGLIKEIDTPYNSSEDMDAKPINGESPDSLRLVYAKTNAHYSKALYSFEGKINVSRTTPIFSIPGDEIKNFKVKPVSVLTNDKRYNIEAYADTENGNEPSFLYMKTSLGATGDSTVGLISQVSRTIDEDNDICTKFTVETVSGSMELYYKDDADPVPAVIEKGDIISFKYDNEYADSIKSLYKYQTKTLPNGNTEGSFGTSQLHYIFGNVYSKGNNSISITTADVINGETPSSSQLESVYVPVFKIFKCIDLQTKTEPVITEGTINDLIDYKNGGASCSKVFMATDWQWPRIIVIY